MPTMVFETKNTGITWIPIYSGMSVYLASGVRLYADVLDTYICGVHSPAQKYLTRIDTRPGNNYTTSDCNPAPAINNALLMMTHYLNEIGMAAYSIAVEVSGTKMYTSYYPEGDEDWTEVVGVGSKKAGPSNEYESNRGVDVVFPDTPNSPRFLVGTSYPLTVSGIIVILANTEDLLNRYSSNLIGFDATSILTDIEVMRFI
jgi:hypothetical protein